MLTRTIRKVNTMMFMYLLKYYQVRNDLFNSMIYDLIFLSALDLFKSPSEKRHELTIICRYDRSDVQE